MVRRKERLGKGEKSIIQRKELHSEPCWCELYESEKWRTIKRDVKIGNMLFEQRTWFSSLPTDAWSCHSFYRWPRKKKHGQVIWTSSSSEWHLEGNCVSSLLPRRVLTQLSAPNCPWLSQLGSPALRWKKQRKAQAPRGTRSSVKTKKKSCFVFGYPEGQCPLQLAGLPLLSSQPTGIVKWRRVAQHVQTHPFSQ